MLPQSARLAAAVILALGASACAPASPPTEAKPAATTDAVLPTFEIPADATPEQRELGSRQVEELDRMLALDTRCSWLDPAAHAALAATAAERRAWLVWQGGEPAAPQPDDTTCENTQVRTAVQYGAWQMRVTWALRAQAMLDGGDQPAWLSGLSTVKDQHAALQEASDVLDERHGQSMEQARPAIREETQLMLASRCRAQADATRCPTLQEDAAFATYADAWLAQAEAYAVALSKVDDKVGTPPSE